MHHRTERHVVDRSLALTDDADALGVLLAAHRAIEAQRRSLPAGNVPLFANASDGADTEAVQEQESAHGRPADRINACAGREGSRHRRARDDLVVPPASGPETVSNRVTAPVV